MEKKLNVKTRFIVNALRNCGYNPYTAIADIIDNSIEKNVNSEKVEVKLIKNENNDIEKVVIIDDGCGMSYDILDEAMSLGSNTGKKGEYDLGMYGAGLKTSALAIGKTLRVFTKQADEELLHVAGFSIEKCLDTINGEESDIEVNINSLTPDSPIYQDFLDAVGTHGTVVEISSIDRLPKYISMKDTLKKRIGEFFNKYIDNGNVKFYVEGQEVESVNLMGRNSELLKSGSFEIDGKTVSYNTYYVPSTGRDEGDGYDFSTIKKQGIYIYRQYRLVGFSLTFGIWTRHSSSRNFRAEIFVDGTCDNLFGSTFNKMVNESNGDNISQAFKDKLMAEIGPSLEECRRRDRRVKLENKITPEEQKALDAFYDSVTKVQNDNRFLLVKKHGINQKHDKTEEDNKEHQKRGKQQNPNPTRTRNDGWLSGFEERNEGNGSEMFWSEPKGNKNIIVINKDHPFYEYIYSNLEPEVKFKVAQAISCIEIAKQNLNYYSDNSVQETIDMFQEVLSSEVRKSLRL